MRSRTKILLDHLQFFEDTNDAFFVLPGVEDRDDAVEVLRIPSPFDLDGPLLIH